MARNLSHEFCRRAVAWLHQREPEAINIAVFPEDDGRIGYEVMTMHLSWHGYFPGHQFRSRRRLTTKGER